MAQEKCGICGRVTGGDTISHIRDNHPEVFKDAMKIASDTVRGFIVTYDIAFNERWAERYAEYSKEFDATTGITFTRIP
ncbi:hypothetical protein HGA64_03735 [Candidatus Falkowbacteria bacterium]|nr:hypothetical protein [Candidatus Falkowbacteria bacterium]